jgi:hypothetical protein
MTKIFVNLIWSLGLTVTFFEKFVELATKAYPFRGVITIGMNPYPSWLNFIIPLNNALSSKWGIFILFILTLFATLYELKNLISKMTRKRQLHLMTKNSHFPLPKYCRY